MIPGSECLTRESPDVRTDLNTERYRVEHHLHGTTPVQCAASPSRFQCEASLCVGSRAKAPRAPASANGLCGRRLGQHRGPPGVLLEEEIGEVDRLAHDSDKGAPALIATLEKAAVAAKDDSQRRSAEATGSTPSNTRPLDFRRGGLGVGERAQHFYPPLQTGPTIDSLQQDLAGNLQLSAHLAPYRLRFQLPRKARYGGQRTPQHGAISHVAMSYA